MAYQNYFGDAVFDAVEKRDAGTRTLEDFVQAALHTTPFDNPEG